VLAAHFPVLALGETYFFADFSEYYHPLRALVSQRLAAGELPLWNSYLYLGAPLLANPAVGTFYPPSCLFLWADPLWALNASLVLHLYLGGAFTYLLSRDLGADRLGALVAGFAFAFGGIPLSYLGNPFYLFGLTWTPLALWAFPRAARGSARAAGVAALALLLQILAGDLQVAAVTAGLLAVQGAAAVAAARGVRLRTLGRAAALWAGVVTLAVLGAAVQVLPALELWSASERAGALDPAVRDLWSLHPARLVGLAVPYPFGTLMPEHTFAGQGLVDTPRFWFHSIYAGVILCAFAPLARASSSTAALWGILAVLLLLALGRHTRIFPALADELPFLSALRFPEKYLAPMAAILPALGAAGLARLSSGERRGAAGGTLAALVLGGVALALLRPELPGPRGPAASDALATQGWLLAAFTAAALGGVALARRRAFALQAVAGLAALDVLVAGLPLRWTAPESLVRAPSPLAAASTGARTRREPDLDRFVLPRDAAGWRAIARAGRDSLRPNTNVLDGVPVWVGYGAFFPGDLNGILARCPERARTLARDLGVSQVAHREGASLRLEPDRAAVSRWRVVGQARIEPGSLNRACDLAGAPAERPIVDAADALYGGEPARRDVSSLLAPLHGGGGGTVARLEESPERLVFHVRTAAPALLVVADTFFPGWRAFVGAREVPILRASFVGRAVPVPAGASRVEMRYEPASFRTGARISLGALGVAALAFALVALRRRRRVGA
jgi:hypothetical protein